MWMPALITRAPLALARSAAGISAPAAAKTIAPSSSSGGCSSEEPAHSAPSPRANACVSASPSRVKAKTRRPWCDGDLAEDVGGGAEAVEADPLGLADQAQRPVADQPGAEQRRRLLVRVALRERQAEALVGDGQLGVAAVEVIAGEAGVVAEVLAAGAAVAALAVGPAEPGDADAVAGREALRPLARAGDGADDLVARHQRQRRLAELAVEDVQVGAADAAGADRDQHLAGAGNRVRHPQPVAAAHRLAP